MKIPLSFVGLLAFAVSCVAPKHNHDMDSEQLTYFSFDHHNTMEMNSGEKYEVSTTEDGRVHVLIDEGSLEEKEFYLNDSTIFGELLDIVKTYKTDKYKENYERRTKIYDGDSWSLSYKYDSQRSVSSGGYMAWPDNYHEMRQALSDYFQKWRAYQKDILVMDYFKFTCKNNQGCDIAYTLERGEEEATMTLYDAERCIDKSIRVSNNNLKELQQNANSVYLKNKLLDYKTDDEDVTRCTYYVRYNSGDTISGITCYTEYPPQKVSTILEFFSRWLDN